MAAELISDELIVKQVIAGSREDFRIIVERYQKRIFSIGMRFFRNEEDAYDFAQEVFIRAFKNLDTFKERAPFRYWLSRIAYNLGISRSGSVRLESELPDGAARSELPTPEDTHLREEVKELLLRAMEELPERYQVCLDFYFFLGLTYGEIGDITGFPVNTIKSHVMRAKAMLRDRLRGTIAEEYNEM